MARVTKEDLKENELLIYFQEIVDFLKKYWEKIRIGLLIGGVIAFFITLLLLNNARTNASAMDGLNSALVTYHNQEMPFKERFTKTRDALNVLLNRYPNANIKPEILFYLGNCHYFLGEYDQAIEVFEKCASRLKKGPLGIYTLQGIGKSNEGKGDYQEAIKIYKKAIDKYPQHFLKPNIELDIGRCYEKLGRINEAIEVYQKILNFSPQSAWAREAKIRINMLKG